MLKIQKEQIASLWNNSFWSCVQSLPLNILNVHHFFEHSQLGADGMIQKIGLNTIIMVCV